MTTRSMHRGSCLASAVTAAVLVASACAAPSITPETKALFQRSCACLHPETPRIPWAVGQWVLLRVSTARSEDVFDLFGYPPSPEGYRRIAITGHEGTTWQLTYDEVSGRSHLEMAILVDGYDPAHLDRLRLLRLRIREPDGKLLEVAPDEQGHAEAIDLAEALVQELRFIGHRGRPRDISVPAGMFQATNAVPISFSTRLGRATGYIMYTNAVPVVYYAKRVNARTSFKWFTQTEIVELVDFGPKGVRGSAPR